MRNAQQRGALCARREMSFLPLSAKNLPERKVYLRETPACASDYNLPPSLREVSAKQTEGVLL